MAIYNANILNCEKVLGATLYLTYQIRAAGSDRLFIGNRSLSSYVKYNRCIFDEFTRFLASSAIRKASQMNLYLIALIIRLLCL